MKRRVISIFLVLALFLIFAPAAHANNTKLIALTFDDGPSWKYTPELLDALAERNVRVTFFMVGYTLEVNMDIAERAFYDGHQLANHTYSHKWFSKTSENGIIDEIERTNGLLREVTGLSNFLLRIPYGDITNTAKNIADSPIIQWSVDPTNGNSNASQDAMYRNFMNTVHDGAIVLLHDTSRKNLNVAIQAIDALLEQGYEFVTLNELFRLRGVAPQAGQVYSKVPSGIAETAFDEAKLSEHWAYASINEVSDRGIMTGDGADFSPNGFLTRAMAATILHRTAISMDLVDPTDLRSASTAGFDDVPEGVWFHDAAVWAHENSYIYGVGGGLFNPNSYITKEEFYTIIARFVSSDLESVANSIAVTEYRDDERISPYAKEGILLLRNAGFISINDPEIFRPGDNITRAEAAELLTFVLELTRTGREGNRLQNGGGSFFINFTLLGVTAILLPYFRQRYPQHSLSS